MPLTPAQIAALQQMAKNVQASPKPTVAAPPLTAQQLMALKARIAPPQAAPVAPGLTPQQLMAAKAKLIQPVAHPIPPGPSQQRVPTPAMAEGGMVTKDYNDVGYANGGEARHTHEISDDNVQVMADGGQVEKMAEEDEANGYPIEAKRLKTGNQVPYSNEASDKESAKHAEEDKERIGFADGGQSDADDVADAATDEASTPAPLSTSVSENLASKEPSQLQKLMALRDQLGRESVHGNTIARGGTPTLPVKNIEADQQPPSDVYKEPFSPDEAKAIVKSTRATGKTADKLEDLSRSATPEVMEEAAKASAKQVARRVLSPDAILPAETSLPAAAGAGGADIIIPAAERGLGSAVAGGATKALPVVGALAGLYGGPTAASDKMTNPNVPGVGNKVAMGPDLAQKVDVNAALAQAGVPAQLPPTSIPTATVAAPSPKDQTGGVFDPNPGLTAALAAAQPQAAPVLPNGGMSGAALQAYIAQNPGPVATTGNNPAANATPAPPAPPAPAGAATPAVNPIAAAQMAKINAMQPAAPGAPATVTQQMAPQPAPQPAPSQADTLGSLMQQMGYDPNALKNAQAQQRQMQQANMGAMAGKEIAAAMSRGGYKPNFTANEQLNQMAALPVQQVMQQQQVAMNAVKQGMDLSDLQDKVQARDPNSKPSQAARGILLSTFPELAQNPNFANMDYETIRGMAPNIENALSNQTKMAYMNMNAQERMQAVQYRSDTQAQIAADRAQQQAAMQQQKQDQDSDKAASDMTTKFGQMMRRKDLANASDADRRVDNLLDIVSQYPDLNQMPREQANTFAKEAEQIFSGGRAHEGSTKEIIPTTLMGGLQNLLSKGTNNVEPAQVGDFVREYLPYMQSLQQNSRAYIAGQLQPVTTAYKPRIKPDMYNSLVNDPDNYGKYFKAIKPNPSAAILAQQGVQPGVAPSVGGRIPAVPLGGQQAPAPMAPPNHDAAALYVRENINNPDPAIAAKAAQLQQFMENQ
jgi:hypothetical protein